MAQDQTSAWACDPFYEARSYSAGVVVGYCTQCEKWFSDDHLNSAKHQRNLQWHNSLLMTTTNTITHQPTTEPAAAPAIHEWSDWNIHHAPEQQAVNSDPWVTDTTIHQSESCQTTDTLAEEVVKVVLPSGEVMVGIPAIDYILSKYGGRNKTNAVPVVEDLLL